MGEVIPARAMRDQPQPHSMGDIREEEPDDSRRDEDAIEMPSLYDETQFLDKCAQTLEPAKAEQLRKNFDTVSERVEKQQGSSRGTEKEGAPPAPVPDASIMWDAGVEQVVTHYNAPHLRPVSQWRDPENSGSCWSCYNLMNYLVHQIVAEPPSGQSGEAKGQKKSRSASEYMRQYFAGKLGDESEK